MVTYWTLAIVGIAAFWNGLMLGFAIEDGKPAIFIGGLWLTFPLVFILLGVRWLLS